MARTGVFASPHELEQIEHAIHAHTWKPGKVHGNLRSKGIWGDDEPEEVKALINKIAFHHGLATGTHWINVGSGEFFTPEVPAPAPSEEPSVPAA